MDTERDMSYDFMFRTTTKQWQHSTALETHVAPDIAPRRPMVILRSSQPPFSKPTVGMKASVCKNAVLVCPGSILRVLHREMHLGWQARFSIPIFSSGHKTPRCSSPPKKAVNHKNICPEFGKQTTISIYGVLPEMSTFDAICKTGWCLTNLNTQS